MNEVQEIMGKNPPNIQFNTGTIFICPLGYKIELK
jgi:hypothetical protein